MKTIKDYISEQKISESNIDMDELLSAVADWFYSHCGEDDYSSTRKRIEDLKVMADKGNDIATDNCISDISDEFTDAEDYWDEIEDKLAELAKDTLKYDL